LLKTAICLLVLLANLIKIPGPLAPYSGSSMVTSKDKKVGWNADWGMEPIAFEGKKAVRFTEKGRGHLSSFPQEVHWSLEALWLAEDAFLPMEFEKTITTADGKELLVERKHFDREKGIVRLERRNAGGALETRTVEVPPDTLAIEGLAGVLRFLPLDETRVFSAHVLSNEPRVYDVTFETRGKERVKTPAGEFECYKLEMVPHLGVLNLFRPFFPKTYFWFTVSSPHYWIRYEGPESGPGTPNIVMELSHGDH
jgi:Protein of unknown function (DUF3108)